MDEKGVNQSIGVKITESILTGPVSADLGMGLDTSPELCRGTYQSSSSKIADSAVNDFK